MTTLITTNDFHSALPEGRATLAALREWRARGAVVIDGGDFFTGSAFYEFSGGAAEERVLATHYDAIIPGNHDLDRLSRLQDPGSFPPVICANLRPRTPRDRWVSGMVFTRTSPTIGVVGYLGTQAFGAIPVVEREGYTFVAPRPQLLTLERDRLRRAGADIVVGVSHSGFDCDVESQATAAIFDIVAAGHCHSDQYYWSSPHGDHHVIKAPIHGAGTTRIELGAQSRRVFAIDRYCTDEAGPASTEPSWLTEAINGFRGWAAEHLGHTAAGADLNRQQLAERIAQRAQDTTTTDAFLLNLGTVRAGSPSVVDRRDLLNALPFDAPLVISRDRVSLDEVLATARVIGEELVCSGQAAGSPLRLGTTSYLAERLGLPADPLEPRHTLRDVFTASLSRNTDA